ncbi:MAG: GrpB family protein [Flavobacteriales bacterium]|nr:GrpB family protein [Flavobacteriales bacterium]
MKIHIEKYNPNWITQFFKEYNQLLDSIDESDVVIEHIGSTSVNGLGAKPVIDIMIGLKDFSTADNHINNIESLGYNYISKYEDIMPYRKFFIKEINEKRTHHIHMVEVDSDYWDRHIRFRDYLRSHKTVRDNYFELKISLSKKEWNDGDEYAKAKTDFIRAIETEIG